MGYGQGSHLPLLLACFQSMALTRYQKNQRCGGVKGNPPNLHDVVYMSIDHGKTIDDFKKRGKVDERKPSQT